MSSSITSVESLDIPSLYTFIQSRVQTICASLSTSHKDVNFLELAQKKLPHLFEATSASLFQPSSSYTPPTSVAHYCDHTVLKADAIKKDFEKLVLEATSLSTFSVCVNANRAQEVAQLLKEGNQKHQSNVKLCCVVGFPLGATIPHVKAYEAEECIKRGAVEIDMVLNIGALRDNDFITVYEDIHTVATTTAKHQTLLKVIFETCLLNDVQIIDASIISALAGAQFVKTSTGFSTAGAKAPQVRLMKQVVGSSLEVKASGGIRNFVTAASMMQNGATRLGVSATVDIDKEQKSGTANQPHGGDDKY